MVVECALEVLQSSALSQVGQARLLQGLGLRGFSNNTSVKYIHVPTAKIFPLQRSEWLGLIFLVDLSGVTSAVRPSVRGKPGGLRGPLTIRTSAAGSLLSHSDAVSTEPIDRSNRP